MKKISLFFCLVTSLLTYSQQLFKGKENVITFFSETPVENISATNKNVVLVYKPATGDLQILVYNSGFTFEKPLMQEHFHENYMETEKFPQSKFVGKVNQIVDLQKDGETPVTATGKLTIHGVTKDVVVGGTIKVKGGKPSMESKFKVKVADYGIKVPSLVVTNIAEEMDVRIISSLEKIEPKK